MELAGERVCRVLDRIAASRDLPDRIVVDDGPELTSRALDQWAYTRRVQLAFIRPGKPIENAFVESFNGKFRDECLNMHWFTTIRNARRKIEHWRLDYNHVRPHGSLGYLPPDAPCSEAGEKTVRLSPRSIRRSGFPAAVAELSVSPLGRLPASVPG